MSLIKEHFFNEINKGQILSVPMEQEQQPKDVLNCTDCRSNQASVSHKPCRSCINHSNHKIKQH